MRTFVHRATIKVGDQTERTTQVIFEMTSADFRGMPRERAPDVKLLMGKMGPELPVWEVLRIIADITQLMGAQREPWADGAEPPLDVQEEFNRLIRDSGDPL